MIAIIPLYFWGILKIYFLRGRIFKLEQSKTLTLHYTFKFFEEGNKLKILFEITQPLLCYDVNFAHNKSTISNKAYIFWPTMHVHV